MHKAIRVLRWLLDEFVAALLVVALLSVGWAFVLRQHLLPVAHGNIGDYAEVAIPEILTLNTRVDGFSAMAIPGHIVQIGGIPVTPIPDALEVWVRYSDERGVERDWQGTFFIACDEDGDCIPVSALSGVVLEGQARKGYGTETLRWAPLNPRVVAPRKPPKAKEVPSPQSKPPKAAPWSRQPA
ncbi:MAG TPA: hypothetical protein VMU12_00890 [Candidatus Paceibacterota bacterium]|nr:hypothetical protein [Candidatus Paceibacterota bacterium]